MSGCVHKTIELPTASAEWRCCDCGSAVPRSLLNAFSPLLARIPATTPEDDPSMEAANG